MSGESLRVIESLQNPKVKVWASLLESRGLNRHRQFLLAGRKSVPEALARHPDRFSAVLTADPAAIDGWTLPPNLERYRLSRQAFARLDVFGTGFPLLVGDIPEMPRADLAAPPCGLEIVAALGDPSNLGALMRSAAAFGVTRLILLAGAAHPFHPYALRAAANAQFEIELLRGPAWPGLPASAGPLFALDAGGRDLASFKWPRDLRLILGEEGLGIPAEIDAERLAIPMTGAVESLNATVAASLAMFLHYLQMR